MQKNRSFSSLMVVAAMAAVTFLSGCAATQVAISKRELDVQTKMSDTIFLDPVGADKRTVFVQVRNTSDKQDFDVTSEVTGALAAKGYRVVSDPDEAFFILQANILQVGKTSQTAAQSSFGGYGVPLIGVATGAGLASMSGMTGGRKAGAVAGAALIGGLIETGVNAMVKDVYYSAITDIQIKSRLRAGMKSAESSRHNLKQGTSGGTTVTYEESSDFKTVQTRVMSVANKVNLDFADAVGPLRGGLARVISGIF